MLADYDKYGLTTLEFQAEGKGQTTLTEESVQNEVSEEDNDGLPF